MDRNGLQTYFTLATHKAKWHSRKIDASVCLNKYCKKVVLLCPQLFKLLCGNTAAEQLVEGQIFLNVCFK